MNTEDNEPRFQGSDSDEFTTVNLDDESKNNLVEYLLSDEYLRLLERAVLARYATSSNNKAKHEKAISLIWLYKQGV